MKPLSEKHLAIEESKTLAINAKANELKAAGIKIINYSSGEPDFPTPEAIRQKAIEVIKQGHVRYTATPGIPELKKAIVDKFKTDNGLTYEPNQIIVSSGAKQSLYNTLQVICEPGDEVIIASPYWTSYPELVKLAGATPVFVDTAGTDYILKAAHVEAAVTNRTKALIINSPNNPTGAVYNRETLEAIGRVATKHDLFVISDEIYEKLIYEGEHHSIASISDDLYQRTIVVNGLSKAYAMTGWRIGYAAASKTLVKLMANMQSHATSNTNTIAQHAAVEALTGDQTPVGTMREAFERRRRVMKEAMDAIPGIKSANARGAFYLMVDVSGLFGKRHEGKELNDATDVAALWLEHAHVAVVPGVAFGADHVMRMSYATSEKEILEGCSRIKSLVESLQSR